MKKISVLLLTIFITLFLTSCGSQARNYAPGGMIEDGFDEGGEEYLELNEREFVTTVENPLSNFSLDSSTYAYTNLRRLIRTNSTISKDAVVIEQMLNYFSYDYVNDTENALNTTTEVGICPWNTEHYLASIAVKAQDYILEDQKNNFVFLIDVSGSMAYYDKLPLFQQAFQILLNQLSDEDTISIVTYASGVHTVLQGKTGNDREEILDRVIDLEAYGSTNGSGGIQQAYQLAQQYYIPEGNNRVLLATDGDFNVGISNNAELEDFISSKKDDGIYLSVFGFGIGNTKHSKMELLASKGNGNAYYIDSLLEAKKVFVSELGGTMKTVAKDTKIQVAFQPEAVASYRLLGYENKMLTNDQFENEDTDAGEIGAGHTTLAFYEIIPTDEFDVDTVLATTDLRYKEADTNKDVQITSTLTYSGASLSQDFIFAAAVVEFALVLRNSDYKGDANYEHVLNVLATQNLEEDFFKSEFVTLVQHVSERRLL